MKTKPCTWNGITYTSIKEAAEQNYITEQGMYYRLKRGYASDEDMDKRQHHGTKCQWNGRWYPSITAAARVCGISQTAMANRLAKGYTCDEDLKR